MSEMLARFVAAYLYNGTFRHSFHRYLLPQLQAAAEKKETLEKLKNDLVGARRDKINADENVAKTIKWLSGMEKENT